MKAHTCGIYGVKWFKERPQIAVSHRLHEQAQSQVAASDCGLLPVRLSSNKLSSKADLGEIVYEELGGLC